MDLEIELRLEQPITAGSGPRWDLLPHWDLPPRRLLGRVTHWLERHGRLAAAVLLAIFFVASLGEAAWKPLWYDELVTVGAASLPRWHDVLHFFNAGLDTTSGTSALIVRLALRLPWSPELSVRLPFILAYACMLVCVFGFVRRRYPVAFALVAAVMLDMPQRLSNSAVEARGYALTMAGTGIALFCWQTAVSRTRLRSPSLLGLWFGLALAVNSHAFGAFVVPAFVLAEAVRQRQRQRADWPVWAALCLFPLGIVPVLHGAAMAKHFYGGHFWAHPKPDLLLESYREMIFGGGVTLVAILLAFCVWAGLARGRHPAERPSVQRTLGFSAPEWTLVAVLAAMPVYALPVSYALHVYRTRYVIPFAIGLFVLLAALLAELSRRSGTRGTVLLGAVLACAGTTIVPACLHGLRVALHPARVHAAAAKEIEDLPWVRLLEASSLPIVAGDNLTYTQLQYYGSPELRGRLGILTDRAELAQYPLGETCQLNLLLFGGPLSYRTADFEQFAQQHTHFLLATRPEAQSWVAPYLIQRQKDGTASLGYLGPDFDGTAGEDTVWDVHLLPRKPGSPQFVAGYQANP